MPERVPFGRVLMTRTGAVCLAAAALGVADLIRGELLGAQLLGVLAALGLTLRHAVAEAAGEV